MSRKYNYKYFPKVFTETALCFSIPCELLEMAHSISESLKKNNVEFVFCRSDSFYPHQFFVLRGNKKWDDIMRIVNDIFARPYKRIAQDFEYQNNQLKLVQVCAGR